MPQRVIQIRIKKSHKNFKKIDEWCDRSRRIYNCTSYLIKQEMMETQHLLRARKSAKAFCFVCGSPIYFKEKMWHCSKKECVNAEGEKGRKHELPKWGEKREYGDIRKTIRENYSDAFSLIPASQAYSIIEQTCKTWKGFSEKIKRYSKERRTSLRSMVLFRRKDTKAFKAKYHKCPWFPKYKTEEGDRYQLSINGRAALKDGEIHFPRKLELSPMKCPTLRRIGLNDKGRIRQVRFVPRNGEYVMEVVHTVEEKDLGLNPERVIGIDPGLSCFASMVANDGSLPTIINGRGIKSMNHYYNKKLAKFKGQLPFVKKKEGEDPRQVWSSKKIRNLTAKRNRKIKNAIHHASKFVIDFCIKHDIGTIVMGEGFNKEGINLGKKNNQQLVQVPFAMFRDQVKYKAESVGIDFRTTEEAYTSQASAIHGDELFEYKKGERHGPFSGKRPKRSFYYPEGHKRIHADINGAFNIIRKAFPDARPLPEHAQSWDAPRKVNVVGDAQPADKQEETAEEEK